MTERKGMEEINREEFQEVVVNIGTCNQSG